MQSKKIRITFHVPGPELLLEISETEALATI